MNLPTIEMDRGVARQAFLAYRNAVRERHSDEDAELMRGYRALANGQQLIRLSDVMKQAGTDDEFMPRLAICRADEKWCRVSMREGNGSATFVGLDSLDWRSEHRSLRRRVRVGPGTFERPAPWDVYTKRAALVPIVPPPLRPKHHLRNYFVLWEAEWKRTPPVDPALLKRISGDLFAVLAIWDLTELERTVLGARAL